MRLVVFGHNDWWVWSRQGFCTRNAALVRELAARDAVDETLVVDSPRFRRRTHRPPERRGEGVSLVAPGVKAIRYDYQVPLPATWRPGRRVNERLAAPGLARRLRAAPSQNSATVLWVADPRLVEPALAVPHDVFVFDAIDDWRQHPWAGYQTVSRGYELAAGRADIVFAVHPRLLEMLRPRGHAEVLFNAVDAEPWAAAGPASELAGMRRPLVGYVGMIQQRVDGGLLAGAARLLPEATFVLAGQVSPSYRRALGDLPGNVLLIGPRPYAEIPAFVAACDVCIVPHLRDDLTGTMDPLKLYEYLAAGKPVVSTVPSPNPALSGVVRIATEVGAFAEAITAEVQCDDHERRRVRRAAVSAQTWPARADRALAVVEEALERSKGDVP